jgi:hypothetical protein
MSEWITGLPQIKDGDIKPFWCAVMPTHRTHRKVIDYDVFYYIKGVSIDLGEFYEPDPEDTNIIPDPEIEDNHICTGWFFKDDSDEWGIYGGTVMAYIPLRMDYDGKDKQE